MKLFERKWLTNRQIDKTNRQDGQDTLQAICQEGSTNQEGRWRRQAQQEAYRELLFLHLQGLEASPPRYRYLQEGNEHHELFHQRYL